MNTELNIAARRIFNRLDVDISDRRGLGNEWDQISPNVKNVEIRRTWEQIITEEIEKHTAALKARVKRLEDELNDNGLVLQKLQDERDKAISMADRLEKAADAYVAVPCGCVCDGPCDHVEVYTNWIKAKEIK